MSIVHQNGKRSEIILLGESFVCNLDESDAKLIGLVVDVLQLLESSSALFTIRLVCPISNEKSRHYYYIFSQYLL
jgi:hypothetical protein